MSKKMKNTIGEFVLLALAIFGSILLFKFVGFIFTHILSFLLGLALFSLIAVCICFIICEIHEYFKG